MVYLRKIGIFGGSFNPIHKDHIRIVKYLIRKKIVDEIWFVPCKKHAFDKKLVDFKHRVNMIKLAVDDKRIKVSNIENKIKGKNYTYRTLKLLKKKYKKINFYLVIGSDILYELKKWYNYKKLITENKFIVVKRKNYSSKNNLNGIICNLNLDISSSEIREKIHKNKDLKRYVDARVLKYIKEKKLYEN